MRTSPGRLLRRVYDSGGWYDQNVFFFFFIIYIAKCTTIQKVRVIKGHLLYPFLQDVI